MGPLLWQQEPSFLLDPVDKQKAPTASSGRVDSGLSRPSSKDRAGQRSKDSLIMKPVLVPSALH